jgi:hypothetical protein
MFVPGISIPLRALCRLHGHAIARAARRECGAAEQEGKCKVDGEEEDSTQFQEA